MPMDFQPLGSMKKKVNALLPLQSRISPRRSIKSPCLQLDCTAEGVEPWR